MKLKIKHVCYTFQLKYVFQQVRTHWRPEETTTWTIERDQAVHPQTAGNFRISRCYASNFHFLWHFIPHDFWAGRFNYKHFKLFELFWPRTNHLWIGWLRMEKMETDRKRWTFTFDEISSFVIKSFVIFKMHKPWHCSLWMIGSFRLRIVPFTLYIVHRAWHERSSSSSFRALSFCRVTRNKTTRSPDLKGNSDFCFPLTLNVPLASVTVHLGISH